MHRFLLCFAVLLKIGNLMTESVGLKADNKMYLAANENSYFRDPSQYRTEVANFQSAWDKLAFPRNLARDEPDLNNYKWYNTEAADSQSKLENDPDDAEIARFSDVMLRLILQPGAWDPPLVIIDGPSDGASAKGPFDESFDDLPRIDKRSRYYRPYPWTNKRQNSRSYHRSGDYDPYNPCTPTRHDVFQLLVALHDAQKGNKSRLVNICNRRRPASDIYTNIRFLGRKK